jgi:hypothetical protein
MHTTLHVNGFTDLLSGGSMEGLLEVGAAGRGLGHAHGAPRERVHVDNLQHTPVLVRENQIWYC